MRMSYALVLLLAACAGDRSITHGADGAPEWDRRLQAAIPVGTDAVAARATLEANQFQCGSADSLGGFRCDKWSGRRWAVVRRRWYAGIEVRGGRVTAVRSRTDLTGP
jgi:hypothetical protein